MANQATVTYLFHSGFLVSVEDTLLVFDYWQGEDGMFPEKARLVPEDFEAYKRVFVFVTHSHPDHYDPVIYTWDKKKYHITYIIADELPQAAAGRRMKNGDRASYESMEIKAFDSTDLGVSFLVELDGIRIFHAGDLNFWHWREESTVQEIEEAEQAFRQAVEPIAREPVIDVAFFPVDPRQGRLYDAGANYFIMAVKPRLLIPMHFWGKAEIATEFARRSRSRQTEIMPMVRPKERLLLDFAEDGFMTITVPPVDLPFGGELPGQQSTEVSLDQYEGSDPFSDSDMPVDLNE